MASGIEEKTQQLESTLSVTQDVQESGDAVKSTNPADLIESIKNSHNTDHSILKKETDLEELKVSLESFEHAISVVQNSKCFSFEQIKIQEKLSHFCIKLYASSSGKATNGLSHTNGVTNGEGQSPRKEASEPHHQNGGSAGVDVDQDDTLEDLRTVYALNVGQTHIGRAQSCEICILDKVSSHQILILND